MPPGPRFRVRQVWSSHAAATRALRALLHNAPFCKVARSRRLAAWCGLPLARPSGLQNRRYVKWPPLVAGFSARAPRSGPLPHPTPALRRPPWLSWLVCLVSALRAVSSQRPAAVAWCCPPRPPLLGLAACGGLWPGRWAPSAPPGGLPAPRPGVGVGQPLCSPPSARRALRARRGPFVPPFSFFLPLIKFLFDIKITLFQG